MNPMQHGFRSGRSCLSLLLEHHNKTLEELEKSNNVDVIYLDFVKAFDKVDHGILLNKLKKIKINGNIDVCYYAFILPILEYCSPVWGSAASSHLRLLDRQIHAVSSLCPDQILKGLITAAALLGCVCCTKFTAIRNTVYMASCLQPVRG